jgi:hypothetical protein
LRTDSRRLGPASPNDHDEGPVRWSARDGQESRWKRLRSPSRPPGCPGALPAGRPPIHPVVGRPGSSFGPACSRIASAPIRESRRTVPSGPAERAMLTNCRVRASAYDSDRRGGICIPTRHVCGRTAGERPDPARQRIGSETEPPNLATEKNRGCGVFYARTRGLRFGPAYALTPKPREFAGTSASAWRFLR